MGIARYLSNSLPNIHIRPLQSRRRGSFVRLIALRWYFLLTCVSSVLTIRCNFSTSVLFQLLMYLQIEIHSFYIIIIINITLYYFYSSLPNIFRGLSRRILLDVYLHVPRLQCCHIEHYNFSLIK